MFAGDDEGNVHALLHDLKSVLVKSNGIPATFSELLT